MLSWVDRTVQVPSKLGHELGSGERPSQQQELLGAEDVAPAAALRGLCSCLEPPRGGGVAGLCSEKADSCLTCELPEAYGDPEDAGWGLVPGSGGSLG